MAEVVLEVIGLNKLKFRQFAQSLNNMSQPLSLAMRYLRTNIKRDARQGKKIGGGTFEPYSQSYQEWLARKGLAGGKKWLTLRGDMLGAMKMSVGKRVASMGYLRESKQAKKARSHNFGHGNIPQREFFGWRPNYIKWITQRIMWPWLRREAGESGLEMRITF